MPGAAVEVAGDVRVGETKLGNADGDVVVAGVEALLFKGLLFKGFPTAMSQR
jgi:hypothetical protein